MLSEPTISSIILCSIHCQAAESSETMVQDDEAAKGQAEGGNAEGVQKVKRGRVGWYIKVQVCVWGSGG